MPNRSNKNFVVVKKGVALEGVNFPEAVQENVSYLMALLCSLCDINPQEIDLKEPTSAQELRNYVEALQNQAGKGNILQGVGLNFSAHMPEEDILHYLGFYFFFQLNKGDVYIPCCAVLSGANKCLYGFYDPEDRSYAFCVGDDPTKGYLFFMKKGVPESVAIQRELLEFTMSTLLRLRAFFDGAEEPLERSFLELWHSKLVGVLLDQEEEKETVVENTKLPSELESYRQALENCDIRQRPN